MSMYCACIACIVFLQNIYGLDLANATLWNSHLDMKRIHPNRCSSNMLTEDAWCQALKMSYCIAGNLLKFRCDWMVIDLTSCIKIIIFCFHPRPAGIGVLRATRRVTDKLTAVRREKTKGGHDSTQGWADLFWANDCIFITTSHQYIFCTDHIVDRTCGIANKNPSCLTEVDPVEASIQRSSFCPKFSSFGSFSVPKVLPFLKGVALERLKCPEEVGHGGTWPTKLQVAACCYVWTFFFSFTLPHFLYNLCNKSGKP